jgi:hypothetical protein
MLVYRIRAHKIWIFQKDFAKIAHCAFAYCSIKNHSMKTQKEDDHSIPS